MTPPTSAILLAFLLLLASALPSIAGPSTVSCHTGQFHNPIRTENAADPWIIPHEGFFFMSKTTADRQSVIVLRSTLLHEWQNATVMEVYRPSNPNGTVYAPELHFINTKWHIYFGGEGIVPDQPVGIRKLFVLEAVWLSPLGPYKFLGQMKFKISASDLWASHPTLLNLPANSQTMYLLWAGRVANDNLTLNIYIALLTDPVTVNGSRVQISQASYAWEKHGHAAINEAPQVLISPLRKYYIVYSASAPWTSYYALGLISLDARTHPLNPNSYTKYNHSLFSTNNNVYSPGGASFITSAIVSPPTIAKNRSQTNLEYWFFYSARDTGNAVSRVNPVVGRTIRAQQFTWDADDLPVLDVPIADRKCSDWPSGDGRGLFFQPDVNV